MTSALSIRAYESDYLVNGKYSCFVRQNQIVITDGLNEWVIGQSAIDELEQTLTEQIAELETELQNHGHIINDIEGLSDSLADKSNVGHGHSFNDITTTINNQTKNLTEVLSELQLAQAPAIHTHSINQIQHSSTN